MVTAVRGEPEVAGLELAGLGGPELAALGALLLAGVTLGGEPLLDGTFDTGWIDPDGELIGVLEAYLPPGVEAGRLDDGV